jgi:hypothetical protein
MMVKNFNIKLTVEELSYIAGFLDGDGSLIAQIVRGKDYKYGFTVRFSIVFFQKTKRHWFILWLKNKLRYGYIRVRNNDGMSEYTITGSDVVFEVLKLLEPYLHIKKEIAGLMLNAILLKKNVNNSTDFIEICKLVDKIGLQTDGKPRVITTKTVLDFLEFPVET